MKPNWQPLIEKLGQERCAGFMYMARTNGINLYKHSMVRTYLNLDDSGQCFEYGSGRFEKADFATELAKVEARLNELGETLESTYDEAYIARKQEALRRAGIPMVRFEIEPGGSLGTLIRRCVSCQVRCSLFRTDVQRDDHFL